MSGEMAGMPMATDSDAATAHPVFVFTSLGTKFVTNISDSIIASDFKKKVLLEHTKCFPAIGDVKINSMQVTRQGHVFELADSAIVKTVFRGLLDCWFIDVDMCKVESHVPDGIGSSLPLNGMNGIGKMRVDGETEGLVNGVDLSLELAKVCQCVEQKTLNLDYEVEGEANVSQEGVANKKRRRSNNDLPSESSEETFKAAAIGEENEDCLPSEHIGIGKKKKTSHPPDHEIAAVQSSGTGAMGTSSNTSSKETAVATVRDGNEKLLSQDVDMSNSNLVVVETQQDLSNPAAAPDAKEMNDSRIAENETVVAARPEFLEVAETVNPKKSSKKRKKSEIRDTLSRQPLTSDAEQVVGPLPVTSSEPHQIVNRDQADQANPEKKTMGNGDNASETAMMNGHTFATSEHLEVVDTVSPKKASNKRKKSKKSSHSALLGAEQVEGSVPVISSTEPQQANSLNDPSKDNEEERTMKEGGDNDLHIENVELNEVVKPENLEKSKKRKKSKKTSKQPPTVEVEGSMPIISSTDPPHQTVKGNHSDQDKWEKGTMKGGQGASETAMVGDLPLATDKKIKPLLDAEQVEGLVPVISSTEPRQANNGNDSFKDNGEERTMKEGEDKVLCAANFELHQVVEPENLKKSSKKKKSKKSSKQPPTSNVPQVEGSLPFISSTEPHQTVSGMAGDLHLDKKINDTIANVVDSEQMKTTHSNTGFANNPSTEAHADKPANDVEVSDESQEINFSQYFVPSNQQRDKGTPYELVEKAPKAKVAGSETKSEKKRKVDNRLKPPLKNTGMDVESRASTKSSLQNSGSMNFHNKLAHGHKEHSQVDGRKPSFTKTGLVVSGSARGKGLIGKLGTIFDDDNLGNSPDEAETDDSDASTRTPSDYSLSSDYTDGETSSVLNTSQNGSDGSRRKDLDGKNISNLFSSGISLDRILKSSSKFKKAKLIASQSELEDTESLAVDFVPDSQAQPKLA